MSVLNDSVFLLSLSSLIIAFFGLMVRYFFKSKCSNISCCFGCMQCIRDTKNELEERECEINHNINEDNTGSGNSKV